MSKEKGTIPELSKTEKRRLLEQFLVERSQQNSGETEDLTAFPYKAMGQSYTYETSHPFSRYVNPDLGRVLHALKLDKRFLRGEGCWIYDDTGTRYLDFTASYGALPFGYNPPEVWKAIQEVASNLEPSFVQPSLIDAAGLLAERLIAIAPHGLEYVTFTNSGAESVEVAIKIARAATGRLGILSTENAFHGKTLGALSATGRSKYQRAFGAPVPGFERVPYGDVDALEAIFSRRAQEFAAFIVEPIQGEGGVITPPDGFLQQTRALCSRYGILLILDEVQTGLGRTGKLFACEREEITPDIMTLAKALGGGLVPIGAVLYRPEYYTDEFAMKHTSTFANNALACRVGLQSLELLIQNNQYLIRKVEENGLYLKAQLVELQSQYPALIRSVRGFGYLLVVEFTNSFWSFRRQCLMGSMAEQESLVPFVCSYLLNVEGIRLAPTVLGASVMRIEPPLVATREMCDQFLGAFERLLKLLDSCDSARLFAHIVGDKTVIPDLKVPPPRRSSISPPGQNESRWAFLVHPLDYLSYRDFDEGLSVFREEELRILAERLSESRLNDIPSALVVGAGRITSVTGDTAFGELIGIPYTADELLSMAGSDAVQYIGKAVNLAHERGAQIVGLGAFTSIVTKNGIYLKDLNIPLTTGNSYTVITAVDSLRRMASEKGLALAEATVAIVGATGSIGHAVANLLAKDVGRLILVGNPVHQAHSINRLRLIAEEIVGKLMRTLRDGTRFSAGTLGAALENDLFHEATLGERLEQLQRENYIELTVDHRFSLLKANIIVTATSNPYDIVTEDMLQPGAIVCNISQPSNISADVCQIRPDVTIMDGGIVELPQCQDLGISFGLARGLVYACMAETMVLALERRYDGGTIGETLNEDSINVLERLAQKHGFHIRNAG